VQANAYITPPGARGLGVHFDTHDVFVLQVAGRKHWVVHEPVIELPMPAQKHPVVADDEPLLDIVLAPGDVLYVPRGFLHAATSLDEVSAHLTIGILADTWYDVLQEVVKQAVDDVAFRAPLPIGYAFEDTGFAESVKETLERFASWVAHLEPDAISRQRRERFWDACAPILTGQFQQLARLDTITDASRVQRRPGTAMYLTTDDDRLLLHLGDRQLNMPADLDGAMRIILHRDTFTVSDLSAELDLDGRLVLIRRLIQEGALENIESLRRSH